MNFPEEIFVVKACLGYRLTLERAPAFDADRAKALKIPVSLWSVLQRGESASGFSPSDVLGAPRKGLSIVYSTDTRPLDVIASYGKDADLMILEGMYGEGESMERAEQTSHMTMCEAAEIAKRAGARSLWLTHYSPAVPNPEDYEAKVKAIFPETTLGFDGLSLKLKFE